MSRLGQLMDQLHEAVVRTAIATYVIDHERLGNRSLRMYPGAVWPVRHLPGWTDVAAWLDGAALDAS